VLLNAFEDQAEARDFLTYYHELTPDSSLVEALARDAENALGRLKLGQRAGQRVREVLGGMKAITLSGPMDFSLQVDLREASEGTITADLTELFLELGKAARDKGRGVAFFLDEVQFIDAVQYRSMISALHRATQKSLPIVVAAAGLPQIPRLSGEARSYAERLFDFPTIAYLAESDARDALIGPAGRLGVEYAEDAVEAVLKWTEGYPFFIQQLGKHAWNLADASPIELGDVEQALPFAQQALDRSLYEVRIQRATDNERRYMRAMAELGDGPYRSGAVAGKLGKSPAAVSVVRQNLLIKGLAYSTEKYGYIDFTVPRFADYMRRLMPFRRPRRTAASKR
jgi:hypothetical protein